MNLKHLCQSSDLQLSEDELEKIEAFVELFLKKNQELNLVKVNSTDEFLVKHILDSLLITKYLELEEGMSVADIGTGGGFPGLILATLYPDVQFTLIDSVQKKINAVVEMAKGLGLMNVTGLSGRLEEIGRDVDYREQFDLVTARALAPMPTLLEYATPLVKVGGKFVAMKGPGYLEEIADADVAMQILKLPVPTVDRYQLPDDMGQRYLVYFDKKKPTPRQFPRRVGVPKKSPL